MDQQEIGEKLKAERIKRKLKLKHAAKQAGMAVNSLKAIERGDIGLYKNFQAYCDLLDFEPSVKKC